MKKLAVLPIFVGCLIAATSSQAIDLKQSKVTQVVNDVQIISAANQSEKNVVVDDVFSMPDILRTGASSRAELVAPDQTVTRVGANTIFSFDPENRTIDLKQGSLLFHSQHGKGGGTIHTGSATASVLGTTIIVVDTPNGGFKVLVLEGTAEVKFLNGLKQKLDAGQMTFVLPGANQLAPIVIFRLDELTGDSLLVKGFSQPLDSINLIENQVGKQLKDISSGKLSDTGLYAGDNANTVQVEVLDPNTVTSGQGQQQQQVQQTPPPPQGGNPPPPPPPPPPPSLSAAEAADATINEPSLLDATPTPPTHVILDEPFTVPNNNYFGPETFSGFVANNIYFNTTGQDPLVVDMLLCGGLGEFDMVALGNMSFEGSVTFNGLGAAENFDLIAGGAFVFTPGITITADANTFILSSADAMDLNDVALVNNTKDINLNSGDSITFENGTTVTAAGRIIASAENNVSLNDATFNVGTAQFQSLNGSFSMENSTINSAGYAIFNAPTAFNFDSSTISADSVLINGIAGATVTYNNTTINANSAISMIAADDINITGSSPAPEVKSKAVEDGSGSALNVDPTTGTVALTSLFGSVNISGTSITAHMLTVNSGDGILLDGSGHTFTASGAGSTASFTAPNSVTVNNANLTDYSVVNMAANTIDLMNVAFGAGSTVTLLCLNGVLAPNPNTGAAPIQGDVNFISNVTYGGNAAQNYVGNGITIGKNH